MTKKQPNCRGSWAQNSNCGSCGRCRAEALAAMAERVSLRLAMETLARQADQWGQSSIASSIRETVASLAKQHEVKR